MKATYLGKCLEDRKGNDIPVVNRGVDFLPGKAVEVTDEHAQALALLPKFFKVEGKAKAK